MLTRCPRCATTFRVTREQLKARQGRVRCGACQQVFDALDSLIDAAPAPAASRPLPDEAALETAAPEDAVPVASVATPTEPETTVAPETPTRGAAPPRIEPFVSLSPESAAPPELAAHADDFAPLTPGETRRRTWPWALGSIAAVLAIAAQATLHFRTELAVLYPDAKPALAGACAALGCELSLPRRADLVGIEASDLSPDADGKLVLSAALKNRAPFAQGFPHLELTLTDTADQALVRRVLAPADYLPAPMPLAAGLGANAELVVNLVVEVPGLSPVGYRLYLFYP